MYSYTISKSYNPNNQLGFNCINIEGDGAIIIKTGDSLKCNASYSINNDVLSINSTNNNITLVLPPLPLNNVNIKSKYDSVKYDGLLCNQLIISSSQNVLINNSIINNCRISSKSDSVNITNSNINNLNINASNNVNVELNDFSYVEIKSENDSVQMKYNGNRPVNVDCTSSHGSVKINGPFSGGKNCKKKIIITASNDIKLS